MHRSALIFALLLLLSMATPASATTQESVSAEDCIQHERHHSRMAPDGTGPIVTISRTGEESVVRYSFNGTGGDAQFTVELPDGMDVTNSSGFDIGYSTATRQYNAQEPWIELELGSPFANTTYQATPENVLVPLPSSPQTNLQFVANGSGYVGGYFALLGEHSIATKSVGCQQIMVVMPSGMDPMRPPSYYAEELAHASRELDIGPRYSVVTAFVTPGDAGDRGAFVPGSHSHDRIIASEFMVDENSDPANPRNDWVHEYVHTRQATTQYDWVKEGAAVYFTTSLWAERNWLGKIRADAYYHSMANDSGMLANDLPSGNIPYARGAFFFTRVAESLSETNTTVEDVYRKVNLRRYRYEIGTNREPRTAGSEEFEQAARSLSGKNVSYANPYDEQPAVVYYYPRWFVNTLDLMVLIVVVVLGGLCGMGCKTLLQRIGLLNKDDSASEE